MHEGISNTFSNNYIECKSNGNKDKTLSIKDYLDKIKPYSCAIINDHKLKVNEKLN